MSEQSTDYDISDVELVRSLKSDGLNIPFNRIASVYTREIDKDEVTDQDIINNHFFIKIKLIDGNGGFTKDEENISFLIEKSKFTQFEKDYDEWIKEMDEKLSKQSFYGGEKKHFELLIQEMTTKLVDNMSNEYRNIIQRQEIESKKKIEKIEKESKERIQELEDNAKRINDMQIKTLEENNKLQEQYIQMQEKAESAINIINTFFTDLTDIKNENESLKNDLDVKRAIED